MKVIVNRTRVKKTWTWRNHVSHVTEINGTCRHFKRKL